MLPRYLHKYVNMPHKNLNENDYRTLINNLQNLVPNKGIKLSVLQQVKQNVVNLEDGIFTGQCEEISCQAMKGPSTQC